jgi:hypothetical protein
MRSSPAGRLLSRHIDLQPPAEPRDGDGRASKQLPVSDTSWRPASDLTVVSGGLGAGLGSCFDCLIRLSRQIGDSLAFDSCYNLLHRHRLLQPSKLTDHQEGPAPQP